MKKILTIILTFSVLALPGFVAAEEDADYIVVSASHSGNVSTPAPAPEAEKDCAQHLADLMNEGMAIVETSILEDALKVAKEVGFRAAFHLSNASSRNPKAAIIVCGRLEEDPDPPGEPGEGEPGEGEPDTKT